MSLDKSAASAEMTCVRNDCDAVFADGESRLLHFIARHPFHYVALKRRGSKVVADAFPGVATLHVVFCDNQAQAPKASELEQTGRNEKASGTQQGVRETVDDESAEKKDVQASFEGLTLETGAADSADVRDAFSTTMQCSDNKRCRSASASTVAQHESRKRRRHQSASPRSRRSSRSESSSSDASGATRSEASASDGDEQRQANKPRVPCLVCRKLFESSRCALQHDLQTHGEWARYPCVLCRHFVARSPQQLRTHIETAHRTARRASDLPCPWCRKRPRLWPAYLQHVADEYREQRGRLYGHVARHAAVRCDACQRHFTDDARFDQHAVACGRLEGRASPPRCSCTKRAADRRGCVHRQTFCRRFPTCVFDLCDYAHPDCEQQERCNDSACAAFWFHRNKRAPKCNSCERNKLSGQLS